MKLFLKSKRALLSTILALVLVIGVGATLAYLYASDALLTNTFSLAEVDTEINEDLTDGNKTVTVKNVGKSPAYVRARLMVSGIDPENIEIVAAEPTETESGKVYLVMPNVTGDWALENGGGSAYTDGFYYYKRVLYGGAADATPSGTPTETSPLLQKVVFADDLKEDGEFLEQFSVTVYHESVLAQDTSLTDPAAIANVFAASQSSSDSSGS